MKGWKGSSAMGYMLWKYRALDQSLDPPHTHITHTHKNQG